MGPGGTVLRVTMAFMGHLEVECVGPDGDPAEGRGDRGVVDKELICHHFKLSVTTNTQVGGT